jgi:hypothetical protein
VCLHTACTRRFYFPNGTLGLSCGPGLSFYLPTGRASELLRLEARGRKECEHSRVLFIVAMSVFFGTRALHCEGQC